MALVIASNVAHLAEYSYVDYGLKINDGLKLAVNWVVHHKHFIPVF